MLSNPRTTLAGLASLLAMLAGLFGSVQTGHVWPVVVGAVLSKLADFLHAALSADAAPTRYQ